MGLLTSLLPGIRDLRTPLAVGALWLFSAYLWFGDRIPEVYNATGVVAKIYSLAHLLGSGFMLAALTFCTYLVGICLEPVTRATVWFLDVLSRSRLSRVELINTGGAITRPITYTAGNSIGVVHVGRAAHGEPE
jgi:hypothetical protein